MKREELALKIEVLEHPYLFVEVLKTLEILTELEKPNEQCLVHRVGIGYGKQEQTTPPNNDEKGGVQIGKLTREELVNLVKKGLESEDNDIFTMAVGCLSHLDNKELSPIESKLADYIIRIQNMNNFILLSAISSTMNRIGLGKLVLQNNSGNRRISGTGEKNVRQLPKRSAVSL